MCGIVAVICPGSTVPEVVLSTMRDRLLHRGPDDGRNLTIAHASGSVALAFRRLSIQDPEARSNQPMSSMDGRMTLVFNGEIYNFWELRRELEGLGRRFVTGGDTEVLLQAFEQWGEGCVNRLNGMFAFFIWDALARRAFVARDRFGEKPLYFTRTDSGLMAFASEVKALLAHPEVRCAPDMAQVDAVMRGHIIHGQPMTLFEDIERFLPAHRMWLDAEGQILSYKRYWTPDFDDVDESLTPRRAVAEFRERLEQAVKLRTRSDVTGVASLSGGLDSSSLVALLARYRGEPGRFELKETISAVFPGDATIDEGPFVDAVLTRAGLPGQRLTPTPEDLLGDLTALHWHFEEVVPSTSMYLEWAVMRRAHELGYKVMIDGQGADELLAGYQYYFQYYQHDQYLSGDRSRLRADIHAQVKRLRSAARHYAKFRRRFLDVFALSDYELEERGERLLMDTRRTAGLPGLPPARPGRSLRYTLAVGMLYESLPSQLHSGDRNAMASSVESRYPFLDYELVDWCIRLPDGLLIRDGWQKYILRKATRGLLPRSVRFRPEKVGYQGPQDYWLRGALSDWCRDQLSHPRLQDLPGFNAGEMAHMQRLHDNCHVDYSLELWRWSSISEWLRLFDAGIWRNGFKGSAHL